MKIGLQDIKWEYIGAKLANADDIEQAAFLKAFVKECLSWGNILSSRNAISWSLFSANRKGKRSTFTNNIY